MRLIDADALRKRMAYVCDEAPHVVDDAPTVDPVKHGRWEHHLMPLAYKCSVCGGKQGARVWKFNSKNYCPECGAKMDA